MAKANSAFDELLSSFTADEDRRAFDSLAAKNPKLKEYGMRQSEFNRRQDEVRDDLQELQEWRTWRANEYDDTHKMTKRELAKAAEMEALQRERDELEAKIALGGLGGDDMNFDELDKWLTNKGVVTQAALAEKEKAVNDLVIGTNRFTADAALTVPYLNQRHQQEFGELFNPKEFLKEAVDKQRYDLEEYYEKEFVVGKRQSSLQKRHEEEIEKLKKDADERETRAKKEGEEQADRYRAMAGGSANPTDDGGPSMGAFQRSYLGLTKKEEGSGAPEVGLGEGGIAAFAAREFVNKRAGS